MADPQRNGVFCAPAEPGFDDKAADELANTTQTVASDWVFPIRDGIEVRAAAKPDAPVIDKLGLYLVRVLSDDLPANAVMASFVKVMVAVRKGRLRGDRLGAADRRRAVVLHQGRQRLEDRRLPRRRAEPIAEATRVDSEVRKHLRHSLVRTSESKGH